MSALQRTLFAQHGTADLLDQAYSHARQYSLTSGALPAFPAKATLSLLKEFDEALPIETGNASDIIKLLAETGGKNTVHYSGGRYFGFVNGGVLPVGIAARIVADVWDQNAALYVMSPIAAKLEDIVQSWLRDLFNLPERVIAGLVGGTSVASLCGLAAARYRQLSKLDWDVTEKGIFGAPDLRIVMGTQTHGTVFKVLNLLGFGRQHIEWVDSDDQGRMLLDELPSLDERCIVILQAGNVCSGAFDDFKRIIPMAKKAEAWVHVDGAFGLWAAASNTFSHLTDSVALANSWSVDGHKTLNTPYDCGIILCEDKQALTHALHQQGSYIQSSDARDSMIYTPDMSRRAKGIELWACLKFLGKKGVSELVELLHHQAIYFAKCAKNEGFEILNDVVFNQVILRCQSDALTNETLVQIQSSGICWCGGAIWQERAIIRVSVCSWATSKRDIEQSVAEFSNARERASLIISDK